MKPKAGIISQARTTSTRLPKKVLLKILDKTLLEYHLERLYNEKLPVYIATTTNECDNPIIDICDNLRIPFHRGDEADVLGRYYNCAKDNNLDIIIRVCSDCPLIDLQLIKEGLNQYLELNDPDVYLSTVLQKSFPKGLDFEIFSFSSLEEAYKLATQDFQREHVTPYINRNVSGKTKFVHFISKIDSSHYRLTVDTPEDFELIKIMIEEHQCNLKSSNEIIETLNSNPHLSLINAHVEQKQS
jgi:spore coat polysaccharide biosynthesis protein SpsF